MAFATSAELFRRIDVAEERMCVSCNRLSRNKAIRVFFTIISRLGNGVFWYVLILSLPFWLGAEGVQRTIQMSVTGVIGVMVYKWLKQRFVRERPFISHLSIRACTVVLDRYSFPSGHTLHAVSFTVLFIAYFPILTWVVVPFATLVAMSRVILGLHYPTDVAMGALLGGVLATSSIALW